MTETVFLWLLVTLFGAGVTWLCRRRIYLVGNHVWWDRWINVHSEDDSDGKKVYYVQISFDDLGRQGTFVNYQLIFYLTLIMAAYGNMETKLLGFRWWHLLGYLSIPVFGLLGQIRGMSFSVVPNFWSRLSIQAKCTCVALVCYLTWILLWQLWLSYRCDELVEYVFWILFVPMVYYLIYKYWIQGSGRLWHVHHWFIGYYWSGIVRYSNSGGGLLFLMMIFWGVFLEGSIYYGATPII